MTELVPQFLTALWRLKELCEQHHDNKNEIRKLEDIIQFYKDLVSSLQARFKEAGVPGKTVESDLKKLRTDLREATKEVQEWTTDQSNFFRAFNSLKRMQELDRLQNDLTNSVERTLKILDLSLKLHQAGLDEKNRKAQIRKLASKQPASSSKPTRLKPMIKHDVLLGDHQLAVAEPGVVYVISKCPKTGYSSLWIHKGQRGKLLSCNNKSQPGFRTTSPPFVSRDDVLYLGVKSERRPAVWAWKAEESLRPLHSPRAGDAASWEYTVLAQSASGRLLYCGCSNGVIEVWKCQEDPTKPCVYNGELTGHVGRIRSLATGQDSTLVSTDVKQSNVLRVWSDLKLVATLDLKQEMVRELACTVKKKLYVATKNGSRLWCDLKKKNVANRPVESDNFALLRKPAGSGSTKNAKSCAVVHGISETVCFLTQSSCDGTYSIEEWSGSEFVSKVGTELKSPPAWTVSKTGTVYYSSRENGELSRRQLHEK